VAADFQVRLERESGGEAPGEPKAVDLRIGEFTLTGKIESIHGDRIVQFRCAPLKPKDWLRAWINHIAKCDTPGGGACETLLVGEDETVRFGPVGDAAALLAGLLEIYWAGLRVPPPFFPASAFAYAQEEMNPTPRGKTSPAGRARTRWNGSEWNNTGEKNDVYNAFCFRNNDPINADFARLAMEIFGPALKHGTSTP
jgi:exodeoxyribonuclease V gamma subunit